jgi:bacteriocin-like protein
MQTRKDSSKQDNRPSVLLPVQLLTEKEMSSVSGGTGWPSGGNGSLYFD